jgi:hypothetical protein
MSDTSAKAPSTDNSAASTTSKSSGASGESSKGSTSKDTSDVGTQTKSTGQSGKSSKDSVGGASGVHYGFFSNTKTPEYRSGWDAIWAQKSEKKKGRVNKAPLEKKKQVTVDVLFSEMPKSVQEALTEKARAELKKSRINYDTSAKKGNILWRLVCEVKR